MTESHSLRLISLVFIHIHAGTDCRVSCVALFRRLFSQAVEIKSEKLGIHANSEYQPFYYTDWQSFLVNGKLRPGVLLPCFDSILRKYIFFAICKKDGTVLTRN